MCTCEFEREKMDLQHDFALNKITEEEFNHKTEEVKERQARARYLFPKVDPIKASKADLPLDHLHT
jgi:hypothetical protein